MPTRRTDRPPTSPDTLQRERAGTYVTGDGRFTVEESSSGWLIFDGRQTDELGLPLARGPFPTLEAAKSALGKARSEPAPTSGLSKRAPRLRPGAGPAGERPRAVRGARPAADARERANPVRSPRAAVVIRALRTVDGDALRALWADCGFRSLGDDDRSLARLARRNPGLVLVAAEGSHVVGSALGAWDGRRGWIYHVATAVTHRRQGIARRLVAELEAGLRALGCPKVIVLVRPEDDRGGREFWEALGYVPGAERPFGKELDAG